LFNTSSHEQSAVLHRKWLETAMILPLVAVLLKAFGQPLSFAKGFWKALGQFVKATGEPLGQINIRAGWF
jgi:hypothetical protein